MALKIVTFKIERYLLELLDLYAMNHGLHRSEAIRLAIRKLLEEEKNELVSNSFQMVMAE